MASTTTDKLYAKGTKCVLLNLTSMSSMNGQLCKIVGSYRPEEERYPVYVYKTKEVALIKPENLKLAKVKSSTPKPPESLTSSYSSMKQRKANKHNKLAILPPIKGLYNIHITYHIQIFFLILYELIKLSRITRGHFEINHRSNKESAKNQFIETIC